MFYRDAYGKGLKFHHYIEFTNTINIYLPSYIQSCNRKVETPGQECHKYSQNTQNSYPPRLDTHTRCFKLGSGSDGLVRRRNRSSNRHLLNLAHGMTLKVWLSWVHTNTLLAEQVDKKCARLVIDGGLFALVLLDIVNVLVEQVGRVKRTALGFGMELSAEDGSGDVDQSLVGLVVQVGEVLLPFAGESCGVNGVSVVLRGNVAFARGEVERGDVMGTVTILELDRLCASGESNQLVTHAYTHDGDLGRLKELAEVVNGSCAVSWVTGSVGDEDTIEVVCDLVDGVVKGEAGDACTSGNETAEDVLLDTTIDQSNVHVAEGRADVEGSLGRDTTDQVDGLRIDVGLILIGIVLLTNGDTSQRGTLLTKISNNLSGVDT